MAMVEQVLKKADVSCFQKVHGSKDAIIHALHKQAAEWHFVVSPGKKDDAGGVVTAVSKQLVEKAEDIRANVFSDGRVTRTRTRSADKEDLAVPPIGPLPQKGMIGVACSSQGLLQSSDKSSNTVWDAHVFDIPAQDFQRIREQIIADVR